MGPSQGECTSYKYLNICSIFISVNVWYIAVKFLKQHCVGVTNMNMNMDVYVASITA